MTHPALAATWRQPDATQYAALSFLARYRGDTLRGYTQDLKAFLGWCAERAIEPLQAQRPHLELYLRWMEQQRGLAPATIGRRFTTVAGFYRYAVIDGHCDKDPSLAVTRPRVPWEGQRRTVLRPLEYAALLTAARRDGPGSHALVALLGMIGLRISGATTINLTDLRSQSGYELLTIIGKGAKPALIPLPVPVLRAVREAADGRSAGPLLLDRHGERLSPAAAAGRLRRLAKGHRPHPAPESAHAAQDVLHRRTGQRRSASRHAVRDAARRLPDHPAL